MPWGRAGLEGKHITEYCGGCVFRAGFDPKEKEDELVACPALSLVASSKMELCDEGSSLVEADGEWT